MAISLKNILVQNKILKINSLFIAIIFWSILNESITSNKIIQVPIIVYNNNNDLKIDAPKYVDIEIKAKKSILYSINNESLGVYINSKELTIGVNKYVITEKNLFLSPAIKLIDYNPRSLFITLKEKE